MKIIFLYAAMLCSSISFAQTEVKQKTSLFPLKNEMGLMAESNFSGNESLSMMGFQYKHWRNEHFGYRIIAAYRQYQTESQNNQLTIQHDTIFRLGKSTSIPMTLIGAGIDIQRRFFRSVYLYAAIELRGGYGSGSYHNTLSIEKGNGSYRGSSYSTDIKGVTMFTIEAIPSIGAKLQYRRFVVGTEASFIRTAYNNISYPGVFRSQNGTGEFTAGDLCQRIYVHYRF
jgi:hypothetical protein